MQKPPVIAAIPTYNMSQEVVSAIDDVIQQDFDAIYVLDDHSSDGTPDMLRQRYGSTITIVEGQTNLGAGGNRSRIIETLAKNGAQKDTIICFIDADVRLQPGNPPFAQTARQLVKKHPQAGIIGG
jgi:GT2 family glycosyltransferase